MPRAARLLPLTVVLLAAGGCGSHAATGSRSTSAPSRTATTTHTTSRAATPAAAPAPPTPTASGLPSLVGVGNVPGCLTGSSAGLAALKAYHAAILRLVVDERHAGDGQARGCVEAAVGAGYRFNLVVDYDNLWTVAKDVAFFRQVLSAYGAEAWAVSIGNEQDLVQGGASETGARYALVWRAVEPVVARMAPRALRVAGEVSPWAMTWLGEAWHAGLPGAQAIAIHAYISHYGLDIRTALRWVRKTGLQMWVTEGLDGPNAWPAGYKHMYAVPLSRMHGVAVAAAWLN